MNIKGVVAIVNFSCGLKGAGASAGDTQASLSAIFGLYGMMTKVPMLWIYSENDTYFPPEVAYSAYNAFTKNGGQAKFIMLPPLKRTDILLFWIPRSGCH